jgi:hypothetical protein
MTMAKMPTTSHAKRSDFFYELFPVSLENVLNVAQEGAKRHNDGGTHTLDGLLNFFHCFYGHTQFCKGTDAWATEKKGMMMPPPDFGERMRKDRFKRWMRHLSEGPENAHLRSMARGSMADQRM